MKTVCILLALTAVKSAHSKDIFDITTGLDDLRFRFLFHTFREFIFNTIGRTGQKTTGSFLQEKFPDNAPFPCDVSLGRSKSRPNSIHKLRVGDINVIGALGDSLTCSTGAFSERITELSMENRGAAWSIGGQWNWRNLTTLPNILKVFNPQLVGYSTGDAFPFHWESQFNLAEIGAVSADMPFMAKALVKRIKQDRRVNFKYDWKMVTIAIGGNDFCSFVCLMKDPESLPEKHRASLVKTLRYLKNNLPRTFVNIVSIPFVDTVMLATPKPKTCRFIHRGECSCWVGTVANVTKQSRERWHRIQHKFIKVEQEVAQMKEFRGLDEFSVMYQPFTTGLTFDVNGKRDYSLLSFDCFHLSQKGNAWAGTSLFTNLLEPPNQKSLNWENPLRRFKCPTAQSPFIKTYDNS